MRSAVDRAIDICCVAEKKGHNNQKIMRDELQDEGLGAGEGGGEGGGDGAFQVAGEDGGEGRLVEGRREVRRE